MSSVSCVVVGFFVVVLVFFLFERILIRASSTEKPKSWPELDMPLAERSLPHVLLCARARNQPKEK